MARLSIDGYGQVELNNVAFRRDGRIEAQCALDTACFGDSTAAENGMILVVDKAAKKVKFADSSAANQLYALNYSAEHMYDERKPGLKNFKLVPGEFLPRLGYLAAGDLFTTNCVTLGTGVAASYSAVSSALASGTAVYAGANTDGTIALAAAAPANGPVLKVIKATTMPDGQEAFQFQVLSV